MWVVIDSFKVLLPEYMMVSAELNSTLFFSFFFFFFSGFINIDI